MPNAKPAIHVRKLEVADFSFVRDLAALQPNFTIPPPYVLWLLLKIKGDVCLLAESESGVPLAYLLAVPVDEPANSLYVWQLATSSQGQNADAVFGLLLEMYEVTKKLGIATVIFSAQPGSPSLRAVQKYLFKILRKKPVRTVVLPAIVAPDESEYKIDLR